MLKAPAKKSAIQRAVGDIFIDHVSHNFAYADVMNITKYVNGIKRADLERQAGAIEALHVREEKWHGEIALAAEEKRRPRHPAPIVKLTNFARQFLDEQEKWHCGMTNTQFVNAAGSFISLKRMESLDQEIENEDGKSSLHDVVAFEDQEPLPRSRTTLLDEGFEAVLDLAQQGSEEMIESLLFSLQKKKVSKRRMLQLVTKFAEKLGQGDLFVGGDNDEMGVV